MTSCDGCAYYDNEGYEVEGITYDHSFGICKRYPPKRIDGATSVFPVVEGDWWCGEHQKKFTQIDK